MKLLAYKLNGEIIGVEKTLWHDYEFSGITFSACTDTTLIPSNYVDISSIRNWGKFGEETGLNFVTIRNEIKKITPQDKSGLVADEIEILNRFCLRNYYKIYDSIGDGDVIKSDNPPIDVNYD